MESLLDHFGIAINYTRELIVAALIMGRTMPMIMLTPFLAGKMAPTEIKMGIGVTFSILLWPFARASVEGDIAFTAIPFLLLMLKEVFVGFTIGFINAHLFWAMEMAGRLIDTVRGTSMAEVQDPSSKVRMTTIGSLYTQLFLVTFIYLGGHNVFMEAYFWSFKLLPLNQQISFGSAQLEPFFDHMVHLTGGLLSIAVILAAPIMAATLITDTVFGILNRVAPQLNAYFMAMPVKALGGIMMILAAINALQERFEYYTIWLLQVLEKTMDLLFI